MSADMQRVRGAGQKLTAAKRVSFRPALLANGKTVRNSLVVLIEPRGNGEERTRSETDAAWHTRNLPGVEKPRASCRQ